MLSGETIEDSLGLAGAPTGRIVFFENDRDVDEDVIWREIVENDAMVVLGRQPAPNMKGGVSTEMGQRLVQKALFWTVPGREPWDDGGAFRGYQFPDRIVRWNRTVNPENREAANAERLDEAAPTDQEIERDVSMPRWSEYAADDDPTSKSCGGGTPTDPPSNGNVATGGDGDDD